MTEVKYLGITPDLLIYYSEKDIENEGADDLQLHSSSNMEMHLENAALCIHCNSKVNDGVVIWANRTELKTTARELHMFQRLACLCISGTMKTCPTASLESLLELAPLHLYTRMQEKGAIFGMCGSISEKQD